MEGLPVYAECGGLMYLARSLTVVPGNSAQVAPGPTPRWARLVSDAATVEIRHNRALIGRSSQADVVLPHDDISRRHALLWREGGQTWIRDLGSANGTSVDGRHLGQEASPMASGSMVAFSGHRYRFMETSG